MEYTSLNPNRKWVNYQDLKAGDKMVEGFFEGEQPGKFSYPNYFFKSLNGEHIAINGCASMKKAMDVVELGDQCLIVYQGTKELPKNHKYAGKQSHMVEVKVAKALKDLKTEHKAEVVEEDDL